jgi:hypothetical protein
MLEGPQASTETIQRADDQSLWFRRYQWDHCPSSSGREETVILSPAPNADKRTG